MAIDTKSLTEIITEFRALQSKDAVSPESLGYILQRIVDLLSTAGTSETVDKLQKFLDGFKSTGSAITSISQGQTDRNHVLVDEYDKPLVGNLNKDDNFEHYRSQLASLYSNFKSSAEHIQLVFTSLIEMEVARLLRFAATPLLLRVSMDSIM